MWYHTHKTIRQNPNFYDQVDESNQLLISKADHSCQTRREYFVDRTLYYIIGDLGNVLTSFHFFKPEIGRVRHMTGHTFVLTDVSLNKFIGIQRWKAKWISSTLDSYPDITRWKEDL